MSDEKPRYVTLRELDEKLETLSRQIVTRWEVRFYVVAGLVATKVDVPSEVTVAGAVLFVAGIASKAAFALFTRS